MSARTEAYAAYLREIYRDYDALIGNDRIISEIYLSTAEVQPEQILSLSENFDIEDLAILVLMEATKDAQDDLHELLDDLRSATQAKRRLRDNIARLKRRLAVEDPDEEDEYTHREERNRDFERLDFELIVQTLATLAAQQSDRGARALADDVLETRQHLRRAETTSSRAALDTLNELSELENLRLQLVLDRRAKFIEALSNIMKKMNDTNDTIAQNLK